MNTRGQPLMRCAQSLQVCPVRWKKCNSGAGGALETNPAPSSSCGATCVAPDAVRVRPRPPEIPESMLLKGGCGYENLLYDMARTGENQYQITSALAGFSPEEITITAEQSTLTVEGREPNKGDRDYLYQGISLRPFSRVFNLADYVQVRDATFENGILKIALVREVPEAMKPRRVAIDTAGNDNQQIERKQTA